MPSRCAKQLGTTRRWKCRSDPETSHHDRSKDWIKQFEQRPHQPIRQHQQNRQPINLKQSQINSQRDKANDTLNKSADQSETVTGIHTANVLCETAAPHCMCGPSSLAPTFRVRTGWRHTQVVPMQHCSPRAFASPAKAAFSTVGAR